MSEILVKAAAGRTWFRATAALIVSAIVSHWIGLWHNGRHLTIYTHALMGKTLPRNQAIIDHHGCLMSFWMTLGLILALWAIGCWVISGMRQEPGRHSVIMVLMAMYVLSTVILA